MTHMDALEEIGTARAENREFRRQVTRINVLLLLVLAALVVGPLLFSWFIAPLYPSIQAVTLTNLRSEGPTDLCPGDVLHTTYTFAARGTGILYRDATIFRVTPPATIVFSQPLRFIVRGAHTREVHDAWTVPTTFIDELTNQPSPLLPGVYKRFYAISSAGADGRFVAGEVTFTVSDQCTERG